MIAFFIFVKHLLHNMALLIGYAALVLGLVDVIFFWIPTWNIHFPKIKKKGRRKKRKKKSKRKRR